MLKKIDNEPLYNKHFLKTETKSYDDDATDFHDKETPKGGSYHTCLAITSLYSALKKMKTIILKIF